MTGVPAEPARLVLRDLVLPGHAPLSLVLPVGEVAAATGESSSELLWVVAGAVAPVSGAVLVDGRPVGGHEQALAAGVALVTQGNVLATLLTAFENVLLPLTERGAVADPTAAARQALEAVGLGESAEHLIEDLSGGQQQRVAVARALALRPRLLLADQATTDLDAGNRNRVVGLLRELADAGGAVLLASDDPAVIAACDRTVVLGPDVSAPARPRRARYD